MDNIETSCFWLAQRPATEEICLQGQIDAGIAIVGAGFTGLWTAYFIKQLDPQIDIAIIEQGVTGYGGSGRNAGIVSACVDHSHALAIKHFGKKEAARLAQLGKANLAELGDFALDCDFERSGQLLIALTKDHLEYCKHNNEVAEELGIGGYRLLDQDQVRAELNSPLYLGASYVPEAGIVNPIKIVSKLKRILQEKGVRFYERSRVLKISGNTIHAEKGSISARRIVLATDSYTHHLFPHLLWRYIPLYDYIMVSEPLTKEQHESIGWKNRQGGVDCRSFFNYYRLTADNRILWGTSEAKYYYPNKVDESCDHSAQHYKMLQESFVHHFPQLAALKFTYRWGGPIASTTRLTPFFGTLEGGKVVYALGYTGHGIGSTRIAGRVLAHMAISKESELLSLSMVQNKPFPYPPEPLRYLSVNAVTQSLRQVDEGKEPSFLLKVLDALGIGFSS